MELTFLGTGTSQGIPVINCSCKVCNSSDHKDKRLRTSAWIKSDNTNIVIDCGPDFRQQMLTNQVERIDAILITHEHYDHIAGLDDIRPYIFEQNIDMPLYCLERTSHNVKKMYSYAFGDDAYPGSPRCEMKIVEPFENFNINELNIQVIPVTHGNLEIAAYKIGNMAYITDAKKITAESIHKLSSVDVLVINALRQETHWSHLNLSQAIEIVDQIKPRKTYFTHISHLMGRMEDISRKLPRNIQLAYDNLKINI